MNAVNDEVKIIGLDGTDKTVYEANLDSGTSPNNGALTQTGNFSFTCNDGLLTVAIGGETLYLADLQALSVGTPVTINTDYGTLLLTGFSGDGTGGTISYTYILNQAVDNNDDAEATDSGFTDSFEVVVTDIDHDEDSATLDIRIVDDSVVADIADSEGDNISDEVITGYFTDPVKGADTSYTADLSVNITGWTASEPDTWFAASNQTTGDSETIYYYVSESDPNTLYAYTDSGNSPTGWAGTSTQELMFTLVLNPNSGTYELVIHSPITTETEMGVNFTTNIGGNNYILYVNESGAITKTAPTSTAFTLTATTNGLADTVNSSTNGYGVGSGKDIGNGELLTLTFSTSISAVETLVFTYNSGTTYTGEVTMILHGVNANGDPDTITLVGTSATLPALIEAQGWESISRIDLTTAPNGEEFNLHGLTTSTLEVDPTGTVLNFNANIVDSDGDIDNNNPFSVTLNAPSSPSVITPVAFASLVETKSLTDVMDTDSDTLVFKAGDKNINNVSFSTDLNDIHVVGIRQPMSWRIEDGILIGSMPGRGDLLKLTLDWNAIEAGEEGSVVVEAELLGRLPHNIDYDSLSVSGIKVVATDSSGQTVKADVTVSVADSQHIAVNDTNQVNVPIDSFEVRGVTAEWTNWTAESSDSDVRIYDSNDDDSANDRIRWGNVDSGDPRSGYNFDENTNIQVGDVGLNQNIVLGTFTHLNYPINGYSAITKATLEVTLMINGIPAKVTLEFDHNETGSGGYNPPDIVTVANTSAVFIYDGARYTLQVMGFLDNNGNVVTSIQTAENRSTSFPLVVKLIPGDGFELPEINGNVLHNDIQGADGNMEIYALSHYGSNASESNGSFIIQGTYGTLTLNDDGTYTYQVTTVGSLIPDNAVDKFSYTIRDSDGDLSSAELNISVNAVNDQPIAPPQTDETVYVGGQGVDSFQLNEWIGDKGLFAVSLGGHGSVASQTINDIISLDTALHVKAGASNDFVELGISTANNIVETGSALPNVSNQLSQQDVLNSRFMSRNSIVDNDDHLKQNVLNEIQPKSDTVNLGEGDDTVYGGEGTQMIYGGAGNDLLIGGAGIDGLRGGAGNDTLIGGLGYDVLRGDSGADTFLWRYADADQGTDHIMDFNMNEDKLDLSDLLQGETANTLESYLNFSFNGTSTTITIDTDGTGSSTTSQVIILDGVDLSSIYGSTNEGNIINGLLTDGALIVDTQPVVFNDISSSLEPLKPNTEN
ncbi:type I secretion C-terminal target domain-containing protein [Shewanella sp.]|uniref:type I secretion C-terminal target domain-containing protein n=1 Tax=Shewanella sp. TaxID=50422 RepID=UPI002627DCE9|nr:type I secretion C-terminal target domain-containing protein [Shewanella sp.]